MYAVLVKVRIDPTRLEEARKALQEEVVPRAKAVPGFVKGTWFGDSESGHGLVLVDSEEQAQYMAGMVTANPGEPAQIESVKVFQVHAEA